MLLHERLAEALPTEKVQILFDYLTLHGDEHYEEDVTQMQHGLQAAFQAYDSGQDAELITAALFHDIGHIIADDPVHKNNPTLQNDDHEKLAADLLSGLFPARVTEPILLHVIAKRYLCTIKPEYYDQLSEASQKSFHLQGGKMTDEEVAEFESNPYYREAVLLRTWDDQAKDIHGKVPPLATYDKVVLSAML